MNQTMHIINAIKAEQKQGKKIVFTNGCFDILHRGHVTYLNHARDLGDVLVVGINSDESVKRLKGSERPVNSLEDRAYVLSALKSVDYVIPFEEDTPLNLIMLIMPNILVKGGDYTIDRIVGAQEVIANGGLVEIIPFVPGKSTSSIIETIKTL
jgi:rfaE bifunctional protein nucleotidyltransferase chain/domain